MLYIMGNLGAASCVTCQNGRFSVTHLVPGTADNRWEDGAGCVVTGEASLAHAGAIVNHESGHVVVTHFVW